MRRGLQYARSTPPSRQPAGPSRHGPPSAWRSGRRSCVRPLPPPPRSLTLRRPLAFLTREHGKVFAEAYFDSATPGGMIDAFYGLARTALEGSVTDNGPRRTEIRHEPYGVVAAILPFNWPVAVLGNKAIPALLTGNTVVAKAPPGCPGAVLVWSAAFAAGLPPGALNVVAGPDAALGEALVSHPGVDMVSFTGSVSTGQAVMRAASGAVRPVVLELGGNDPAIMGPDIEVDAELARRILDATFVTSGQVCMAIKRLYVPNDQVAAYVEALNAGLAEAVVGDGLEPEVTMGPVHRPQGRDFVEGLLAEAVSQGSPRPQARHRPRRGCRTTAATSCRPPSSRTLLPTSGSCAKSSSVRRSRSSVTATSPKR